MSTQNPSPAENQEPAKKTSKNFDSPVTWPSPCKLNLFLSFVGQREDGYHLLQSVFQLLDFGDSLTFSQRPIETEPNNQSHLQATENMPENIIGNEISLSCNIQALQTKDNLVLLAANALRQWAINEGFSANALTCHIHLEKILPFGGGVGGGSSNCATTLLALNHHWQLGLTIDQLASIGLTLGADVPFFVHGQTAFVEGIGEKITPFKMPEIWYLVVHPDCHISTAKIFSNPLLTRNSKAITIRDLNALELPYQGQNSMQDLVCSAYPEVDKALIWLKQFSQSARMTGSGSCLFIPFDNEQEVRKIASRCHWPHFVAKGVNVSPVHRLL